MRRGLLLPIFVFACASESPPPPAAAVVATPAGPACDVEVFRSQHPGPLAEQARAYLERCGQDEAVALTKALVAFPTVSAEQSAADGPAFLAMRQYLETWSRAAGLEMETFGENDAWIIGYGPAAPSIGFLMHADVVPVHEEGQPAGEGLPPGWSTPPFELVEKDGRLYGRGTEDDKGPIASTLVVLKTLKAFGYQPQGRLQVMLGTGEEHDWDGMVAYSKAAPHPRFVISVDAEFPVVVGESGFVAWKLGLPLTSKAKRSKGCLAPIEVKGGQFLTQVPGEATLSLPKGSEAQLQAAIAAAQPSHPAIRLEVETLADKSVLRATGLAVHSSVAEDGQNALWALAAAAGKLPLCPGGIRDALAILRDGFEGDHYGVKLGLAYEHPVMGKLLVIPTVLRTEASEVLLSVNMRRPEGETAEGFGKKLEGALALLKKTAPTLVEKEGRYVGNPQLADTTGPLVSTLLDIFRTELGVPDAQPITIRGGTYARLFPGAVSFGPALPKTPYRGHAPDEYLERSALRTMLHTQLQAILRLDSGGPSVTSK